MLDAPKRLFVGRPLRSDLLGEQLLPKRLALPVFCSDPLSSVAYATEQIVLVLGLGGLAYYRLAPFVAGAVGLLLIVVVASYRQTCYAYPNGGGAYVVASDNLGSRAGLTAAAALLVDYVLTVAVSVVAGVAALTSGFPRLLPYAVELSLFFVVLVALVNLRGVRESGRAFAVPTYGFIAVLLLIFAFAGWRYAAGQHVVAESAPYAIRASAKEGGLLTLFLALRAFASGCTALTGVEAISNGVPAFRKPKSRNASQTLGIMGVLAVGLFIGTTILALVMHVHASEAATCGLTLHGKCVVEQKTVIAQIAAAAFGSDHAVLFYVFQLLTAAILILAANTAFNGFPVLASILAKDGYLPRQLHNRGDRLVYSNGIVLLAIAAAALIFAFNANVTRLVQLYIIGVFVSFTLSQTGMVRHWQRKLSDPLAGGTPRAQLRRSQLINTAGAAMSGLVLIIVLITKFTHGAWLAVAAMVIIFLLMEAIGRHYRQVSRELLVAPDERPMLPARNHAIVLVSKVHLPTMRALAYAKGTRPSTLEAVTIQVDADETRRLQERWDEMGIDVPLVALESQFRDLTKPVVDYVRNYRRMSPRDVVTVFVPEYVVGHWWEHLLHNQSALRLRSRLRFEPGIMVTSVPWQMKSTGTKVARLTSVDAGWRVPSPVPPRE